MDRIIIVIPAYEPDERLISLIKDIASSDIGSVVIVDDGSGDRYTQIFEECRKLLGDSGMILTHEVNKGKGRALKTAFAYILDNMGSDVIGAVTADSDGQHTVSCIREVKEALKEHPDSLILGVRSFPKDEIPWKSYYGNMITMKFMKFVSGVDVSDTQSGLRGIPGKFMRELLETEGERFEFETKMLLETVGRYPIVEVPISTIYDSVENHSTHFAAVKDSVRIYKILAGKFIKYMLSSLISCGIDIVLFTIFCHLFKGRLPLLYITVSTVLARICSSCCNYAMNYAVVFKSKENKGRAAAKYFILVLLQMSASALLVTLLHTLMPQASETVFKIIVDVILFFVSYFIQRNYVFSSRG